jgi:hypothetical protein
LKALLALAMNNNILPFPSRPLHLPHSFRLYGLARSSPSPHTSRSSSQPAAVSHVGRHDLHDHHKRHRHVNTGTVAADINTDALDQATTLETRANLLSAALQGVPHIETPRILAAPLALSSPSSRSAPPPLPALLPRLKTTGKALRVAAAEHTAHLFPANRCTIQLFCI